MYPPDQYPPLALFFLSPPFFFPLTFFPYCPHSLLVEEKQYVIKQLFALAPLLNTMADLFYPRHPLMESRLQTNSRSKPHLLIKNCMTMRMRALGMEYQELFHGNGPIRLLNSNLVANNTNYCLSSVRKSE